MPAYTLAVGWLYYERVGHVQYKNLAFITSFTTRQMIKQQGASLSKIKILFPSLFPFSRGNTTSNIWRSLVFYAVNPP